MSATARPLSPHISIYRWQIQMVTSILHRASGVALAAGTLLLCLALVALAAGPEAFAQVRGFCTSWIGLILLFGWTWAFSFHLLNGVRHLLQDIGLGFEIAQLVRNSWLTTIGSVLMTAGIWIALCMKGAGA